MGCRAVLPKRPTAARMDQRRRSGGGGGGSSSNPQGGGPLGHCQGNDGGILLLQRPCHHFLARENLQWRGIGKSARRAQPRTTTSIRSRSIESTIPRRMRTLLLLLRRRMPSPSTAAAGGGGGALEPYSRGNVAVRFQTKRFTSTRKYEVGSHPLLNPVPVGLTFVS